MTSPLLEDHTVEMPLRSAAAVACAEHLFAFYHEIVHTDELPFAYHEYHDAGDGVARIILRGDRWMQIQERMQQYTEDALRYPAEIRREIATALRACAAQLGALNAYEFQGQLVGLLLDEPEQHNVLRVLLHKTELPFDGDYRLFERLENVPVGGMLEIEREYIPELTLQANRAIEKITTEQRAEPIIDAVCVLAQRLAVLNKEQEHALH